MSLRALHQPRNRVKSRPMKQVIQSRRSGKLAVKHVPEPKVRPGHVLVKTRASLISAGTERMVVDFAKKSLAAKAKARPDLVKKVLEKARRDGLHATFKTVMARLDEPLPLGYSACGEILAVGPGLEGTYRIGDRVAMAGAGVANHAELNVVPKHLTHIVGDDVTNQDACYGTMGAIALHAVRNLNAKLGDVVAVIGCGLLGQLACQLLSLSGVRVLALDYNPARLKLAQDLGAEAVFNLISDGLDQMVMDLTHGLGCDGILISAATKSSEPFDTAARIARDRARVTMVGLTGTTFPYQGFMEKELNLVVSRSYGPGRYDADFESRGVKYPEGWVRWTETANLGEIMRLLSPVLKTPLNVDALTSHRFDFANAEDAYQLITTNQEPHLGVVLTYDDTAQASTQTETIPAPLQTKKSCVLGMIGAGGFARAVLLPELKRQKTVTFKTICTQRGASAEHSQKNFDFKNATSDEQDVLNDTDINAVIIATRHDAHADLTAKALNAGKAVLVEKPLSLDLEGINQVIDARNNSSAGFFQVGFNRRFAPMAVKVRNRLDTISDPKVIQIRVNAGAIAADHWVHEAHEGGGRILGEVCHFIDFARFLSGHAITSVHASSAKQDQGACDNVAISLNFEDGSLATILYTAKGDSSASKERYEVFAGGVNCTIDDFRKLSISGNGKSINESKTQDKGFKGQLRQFIAAAQGQQAPAIDENVLIETAHATLAVLESLQTGETRQL